MKKKRIVIGAFVLATATAYAQISSSNTLTYEAITANSPVGISRLRVTQVETNTYAIDFSIVAPNPTQHTGHIQGLATREGSRLTLKTPIFQENGKIDHPSLCTLVLDLDETRAKVVSENDCAGFGGAATNFVEQGRNLVRIP
nr:hypothetical protein [uncultured Janthinobacterium sp.]